MKNGWVDGKMDWWLDGSFHKIGRLSTNRCVSFDFAENGEK